MPTTTQQILVSLNPTRFQKITVEPTTLTEPASQVSRETLSQQAGISNYLNKPSKALAIEHILKQVSQYC
jgi:hypothetical protein